MDAESFRRYVDENVGNEYQGAWAKEPWTIVGVCRKGRSLIVCQSKDMPTGRGSYDEDIRIEGCKGGYILSWADYQTMEDTGAGLIGPGPHKKFVPTGTLVPTPDTGVHPGVRTTKMIVREELEDVR